MTQVDQVADRTSALRVIMGRWLSKTAEVFLVVHFTPSEAMTGTLSPTHQSKWRTSLCFGLRFQGRELASSRSGIVPGGPDPSDGIEGGNPQICKGEGMEEICYARHQEAMSGDQTWFLNFGRRQTFPFLISRCMCDQLAYLSSVMRPCS